MEKEHLLVRSQLNSGSVSIPSLPPGPHNTTEPVLPMAFRIAPLYTATLPNYMRSLMEGNSIGTWSNVAYKVAVQNYSTDSGELCRRVTNHTVSEILPSCPCTVFQARIGNSGFLEQRLPSAVQANSFFHPKADTCFVSLPTTSRYI